jgi:uncharacterized protein (TIGR02677 family)
MDLLRVPPEMFRFTTGGGDRGGLYLALMHAFAEAVERLETALTPDDVRTRLRSTGRFCEPEDDDLRAALEQLRDWGLLDAVQNHTENYRTASEYERRNVQYFLTKRGEAAYAGVTHAMTVLASTGALQTAVLDAIADRLTGLAELLGDASASDRRVFTTLTELETHLEALRTNTAQFNSELQRLLRAEGADLATFHEVKAATVGYLQEFLTDLDQRIHAIATGIARVEDLGAEHLWQRALLGAELPPTGGKDVEAVWLGHRRTRWEGLRAWFAPADGCEPRADQLRDVARRAIITLLQALDRITESRRRSTSAIADFRELARWFALAPAEADLHRLWACAFGLGSARHAHLAHADPELVDSSHPWSRAAPVEISGLLRVSGRTERYTRTAKVRDVAAVRRERTRRAAAERAELQAAWSMLDTGGPVRLSHLGRLDHDVFERLLDLLGRALGTAADTDGTRRGTTSDGRVEIVLRPGAQDAMARLHTPHGVFEGPDYEIEIRSADRPVSAGQVTAV